MNFGRKFFILAVLIALIWISVGIFMYRSFPAKSLQNMLGKTYSKSPKQFEMESIKDCDLYKQFNFWRNVNLYENEILQSTRDLALTVGVTSNFIMVKDIKVSYLSARPPMLNSNVSVLFLHGQSFTSKIWTKLGTLQIVAAMGYYAVAVDLPGYGSSEKSEDLNRVEFIHELLSVLKLVKPVIVSPSMSGSFSLKYMILHSDKMAGFIPVSPVRTNILNQDVCGNKFNKTSPEIIDKDCKKVMNLLDSEDIVNLSCIKVPTLVVYGEKDRQVNSARLCLLPNSQGAEIPQGAHAAYLSNHELWHKLLYNFLGVLNQTLSCA